MRAHPSNKQSVSKSLASRGFAAVALAWFAASCMAQDKPKDSELDALDLKAEPAPTQSETAKPGGSAKPLRLLIEGAWGRSHYRYGLGDESNRRLSLDLRWSGRLAPGWRAVFSDRIDHVSPTSGDRTINTLREAYVGWQDSDATTAVEFGRINLRTGPGYGYNPSDFFREGSLRTVTTLDPIALRDSRMGTLAVRVQRLWQGGGLSLVVAPKADDQPNPDGASLDLGSTNPVSRAQLAWSQDLGAGVSMQWLVMKASRESVRLGASLTSLLGGHVVAHLEGSYGKEAPLVARILGAPAAKERDNRLAAGLTASLPGSVSLTAEWQRNGFGLSKSQWNALALAGGPGVLGTYLQGADRLQDLPARQALLVYLSKKALWSRGPDLTALVQYSPDDHSRLTWLELRQHLGAVDLSVQWQQLQGSSLSQYGVLPLRRSGLLVLTYRH
jgi:hypothetical protein